MKKTKAIIAFFLTLCTVLLAGCGDGEEVAIVSGSKASSSYSTYSELYTNESFYLNSLEQGSSDALSGSDIFSGTVSGSTVTGGIASGGITSGYQNSSGNATSTTPKPPVTQSEKFSFKGIWISFIELNMKGLSKGQVTEKINVMMKTAKKQGYNAVFGQVRPYGDAVYPSKYFPFSKTLTGAEGIDPGYDLLKIMLDAAKKEGLEFHAWINPYRVRSSYPSSYDALAEDNIAKKWLADGSNRAIAAEGGLYFNPASKDVRALVKNGVKEILENYAVDGIHFDDYFYPTTAASFDKTDYDTYKSQTEKPLSLGDWRRANVDLLVSEIYSLCHKYSGVTFGISPAGDISTDKTDKNYNEYYANIPKWMANKGYVDYITPQIYFGYNYPQKKFAYDSLLSIWSGLKRHSTLKIYIGLGAYKIGDASTKDAADWCDKKGDLLARQVKDAKAKNTDGFVVFSYSSSVSENPLNSLNISNMFSALK